MHPLFYKQWFPFLNEKKEKVIMTDVFLQKDFYKQTMEKINENKYDNIVIIAGSHSGFSTAWLMLNGPASYCKNNSRKIDNVRWPEFPGAVIKSN